MPIRASICLSLDSPAMRDMGTHRHQIANIPQPPILDLGHQGGDPAPETRWFSALLIGMCCSIVRTCLLVPSRGSLFQSLHKQFFGETVVPRIIPPLSQSLF